MQSIFFFYIKFPQFSSINSYQIHFAYLHLIKSSCHSSRMMNNFVKLSVKSVAVDIKPVTSFFFCCGIMFQPSSTKISIFVKTIFKIYIYGAEVGLHRFFEDDFTQYTLYDFADHALEIIILVIIIPIIIILSSLLHGLLGQ